MFERREPGEIGVLKNIDEYDYINEMREGDFVRLILDDGSEQIPYLVLNFNTKIQTWAERDEIEWFDGCSKNYD